TMQIRLSVQPMMGTSVIDTAAHLVFNISPTATPATLVKSLFDIKKASKVPTTGKPLGVHPGLGGSPMDTHLAGMIADFVKTTVASSSLFAVAFMGLGTPNKGRPDGAPWTFYSGVVSGSEWTPLPPTSFDVTHGKQLTFAAPAITFTGASGAGILVGQQE